MAKGIPLMGRDPDGNAKIINVDENGNVKVQLKGSNVVLEQGSQTLNYRQSTSVVVDPQGLSTVTLIVVSGMRSDVLIEGYANDTWFELERRFPFYTSLVATVPCVGYDSLRITIRNIGRITTEYKWEIRGSAV